MRLDSIRFDFLGRPEIKYPKNNRLGLEFLKLKSMQMRKQDYIYRVSEQKWPLDHFFKICLGKHGPFYFRTWEMGPSLPGQKIGPCLPGRFIEPSLPDILYLYASCMLWRLPSYTLWEKLGGKNDMLMGTKTYFSTVIQIKKSSVLPNHRGKNVFIPTR